MVENKEAKITEDELQELLESGEFQLAEAVEDEKGVAGIGFDIDVIASMEEITEPIPEEFDKGVLEASQYIGQFTTLINSGLDSDTAILIMSWIREDKLNKDNIKCQIEMAKQESIKIKRESL